MSLQTGSKFSPLGPAQAGGFGGHSLDHSGPRLGPPNEIHILLHLWGDSCQKGRPPRTKGGASRATASRKEACRVICLDPLRKLDKLTFTQYFRVSQEVSHMFYLILLTTLGPSTETPFLGSRGDESSFLWQPESREASKAPGGHTARCQGPVLRWASDLCCGLKPSHSGDSHFFALLCVLEPRTRVVGCFMPQPTLVSCP